VLIREEPGFELTSVLAEESLLVAALLKCSCVQEMPVLSELPSFGFSVALYVYGSV